MIVGSCHGFLRANHPNSPLYSSPPGPLIFSETLRVERPSEDITIYCLGDIRKERKEIPHILLALRTIIMVKHGTMKKRRSGRTGRSKLKVSRDGFVNEMHK